MPLVSSRFHFATGIVAGQSPSPSAGLRIIRLLHLLRFCVKLTQNQRENSMSTQIRETATPTDADTRAARESLRRLVELPDTGQTELSIRIQSDEKSGTEIKLPLSAFRLLKDILAEMAEGHGVTLLPVQTELTTQQAAGLLNVSRPYLIGLLEDGKIPFRLVGRHRRVRFDDLAAYKRKDDEGRRRIADELAADAQDLGVGY
jgi:excisionase family DNA binding protein